MRKINTLIANANNYFTDSEVQIIKESVRRAEAYISSRFDKFDYSLDLLIAHPSYLMSTIEEDGVCGHTYDSRLIGITLDKSQAQVSKNTVFETVCHEISHSLRWEKQTEYVETLFDNMILEGLAVVFEEQALHGANIEDRQFFLQTVQDTTKDEYDSMIKVLQPSFSDTTYSYDELFFNGNDEIPRWTVYRLGYYYVKQYLKLTGRTLEQATFDSYKEFRKII